MLLINRHIAKNCNEHNFEGQPLIFSFGQEQGGKRDFHGSERLMGNFPQIS